jgi:uncharacterized protein
VTEGLAEGTPARAGSAPSSPAEAKEERLFERLASLDTLIIAFSGGVDSAYLAWAATRTLGRDRALCVTADSPSYPDRHRQIALRVARTFAFQHELIHTTELERPEYRANPTNRCYFCKHTLYASLSRLAAERGFAAIADGSNADDRGDYRPGREAAREFGVLSPLDEVGLTKEEIRSLSRLAALETWDEPASACLSSRIPYHSEVTDAKLRMIERAEDALRSRGFRVCRVRHHEYPGSDAGAPPSALARIEVGRDELARLMEPDVADDVVRELTEIGYRHVTIDLRGYRMGSLNEGVHLRLVN